MKLTNNYQKLLAITVVLLAAIAAMIAVGILTRPSDPISVSVPSIISKKAFIVRTLSREELMKIYYRSQSDVSVQFEKIKEQEQIEEEIKNLSPRALYINYAYAIAHYHYPKINPEYVCAIIYHESRFKPDATNPKTGVQGLTQISPKWHMKRAESLGVTDLYEPYGNILVCFDILNDLTETYGFDYAMNFYAGGYAYANNNLKRESNFMKEIKQIIADQNFEEYLLPYYISQDGGVLDAAS